MKNVLIRLSPIVVLAAIIAANAWAQPQSRPLRWTMQACGTLDCVTGLLQRLPPERALEAKVTTINSQRSFMGVLSDPYYVWFRQ